MEYEDANVLESMPYSSNRYLLLGAMLCGILGAMLETGLMAQTNGANSIYFSDGGNRIAPAFSSALTISLTSATERTLANECLACL